MVAAARREFTGLWLRQRPLIHSVRLRMPFRQRLLPKIISRKRIVRPPGRILLTVQHGSLSVASGSVQWIAMIETIAAFPGLIGAAIFLAHAFDGLRSGA
jgi:hypothetical protein